MGKLLKINLSYFFKKSSKKKEKIQLFYSFFKEGIIQSYSEQNDKAKTIFEKIEQDLIKNREYILKKNKPKISAIKNQKKRIRVTFLIKKTFPLEK